MQHALLLAVQLVLLALATTVAVRECSSIVLTMLRITGAVVVAALVLQLMLDNPDTVALAETLYTTTRGWIRARAPGHWAAPRNWAHTALRTLGVAFGD